MVVFLFRLVLVYFMIHLIKGNDLEPIHKNSTETDIPKSHIITICQESENKDEIYWIKFSENATEKKNLKETNLSVLFDLSCKHSRQVSEFWKISAEVIFLSQK